MFNLLYYKSMKKKLIYFGGRYKFLSSKTIKIMKLSGFLLMLTILQVLAVDSYSQRTKLTFDLKNVTVKDALRTIEDQSEFFFLYSPKMVDVSRKVDIESNDKKVDFILNQMFAGTGVDYVIKDRQIVIATNEMIQPFKKETPQQVVVTGKVTGEDGNPLPGVNIVIKGTIQGSITDSDGNYSIEVGDPNATLVFSFIGYKTQELAVNNQTTINVIFETEAFGLDEVVAIGYGTVKRATVTGSISAIKGAELDIAPVPNFTQTLAGRLPGLVSVSNSGEPGNEDATLRIRGTNTLGDNSPLIVIDSIANRSLSQLRSSDIESITVLKDASAAIYGAQAANGVIVVTTKRGSKGKPEIIVNLDQGWSMPTVIPEMADAATYTTMINEIDLYQGQPPTYTTEEIQKFKDGSDPWKYPNTDWFDVVFKDFSKQYSGDISVRGGAENIRFFISGGYDTQDAIYKI